MPDAVPPEGPSPEPAGVPGCARAIPYVGCGGVVATMIFEGVVLGGVNFGWPGAVLGPVAIYLAGFALGLAALVVLAGVWLVAERWEAFRAAQAKRRRARHPMADEDVDATA